MSSFQPTQRKQGSLALALVYLLLAVAIFILVPLLTLWSLNVLFSMGLAYTFKNWLACVVIKVTVFGIKLPPKKNPLA